jgi:glucose-6-phosphate isomerase
MGQFIEKLHAGDLKGHTGKSIDTFIAKEINQILSEVDPETTLFCVSSKSFSTKETLINATSAKQWLISNGCKDIAKHFIAVSANKPEVKIFGIDLENCFQIWDWVGGRYSLWSAIGLPIAVSIGIDNFRTLLAGAKEMDDHFISSPPEKNIPILLAMLDIWYINFYSTSTLAVIPYDESLKLLPDYLCQLFMESNGKNITHEGQDVDYPTAPIVWGGVGTNAQHAFFQLLHQGTHLIPVELLVPLNGESPDDEQHKILLANCFAQSKALMTGNIDNKQKSYQKISGNKPSTTIIYNELSPKVLGSLLAMYEHRTYVQGHIWNINSFDQWGVELGKKVANSIVDELNGNEINTTHDVSTKELITRYINRKK